MNCSLLGSFVHGIFQARIMEWVAICFSRVSSQPRDQTLVLLHHGQTLYHLSHQGSPNINMLYNLKVLVAPVMSNSLWPMDCSPPSLLCPWDFPNINTGVGCHSLLQGSSWSRDQTWVPAWQMNSLLSEPPLQPELLTLFWLFLLLNLYWQNIV